MCRSHPSSCPPCHPLTALLWVLALAALAAPAAALDLGASENRSSAAACLPGTGPMGGLEPAADLLLYGVETRHLDEGNHQVHLRAMAGLELLLSETFQINPATLAAGEPFADQAVFELLAASPELRQVLFEEGADGDLSVEVEVDGILVDRLRWAELLAASGALRSGGALPVATQTSATLFAQSSLVPTLQIPICGDGNCDTTPIILPEDCETCPQDCGSACSICGNNYCGPSESCQTCSADCGSCPSCPTTLSNQTRTELIGQIVLSTVCLDDVFYPWDPTVFDYTRFSYKRYVVSRVRECDLSITETVVPGSTTYFYKYCYGRTANSCSSSFGSPSCWF